MAFKPKIGKTKKVEEEPEEDIEEVEEEAEEEIEEEQEEPKTKQKSKDVLAKQEIADVIEGNLNRALQLLQYLRA